MLSNLFVNMLYLFLMANQARFQMVNRIINQNKGKLNLHELQNRFGSRLTSKMIRKYEFTNNKFLKKYSAIERRYEKGVSKESKNEWLENERKLFIWFSIIFCNHLHRNYDQLVVQDWNNLSYLFFNKGHLLLQYETKQIQRNPQRVFWAKREQAILLDAVKHGKMSQWNQISKRIFFQTAGKYYKTSKQCREHWFNHLDKSKKKGDWTKAEDLLLLQTVRNEGRKWSTISYLLGERRTEHMVKNRYNSLIKVNYRSDNEEFTEESVIRKLIAKLEVEVLENEEQIPQQQNERQAESDERGSQRVEQPQGEENLSNSSEQQIQVQQQILNRQENNYESRNRSEPSQQPVNQGWNNMMSGQAIHSPYFFVFSPFSFSSTASPYVNSFQSWTTAHQTLFFNPQSQLSLHVNSGINLQVKQECD